MIYLKNLLADACKICSLSLSFFIFSFSLIIADIVSRRPQWKPHARTSSITFSIASGPRRRVGCSEVDAANEDVNWANLHVRAPFIIESEAFVRLEIRAQTHVLYLGIVRAYICADDTYLQRHLWWASRVCNSNFRIFRENPNNGPSLRKFGTAQAPMTYFHSDFFFENFPSTKRSFFKKSARYNNTHCFFFWWKTKMSLGKYKIKITVKGSHQRMNCCKFQKATSI